MTLVSSALLCAAVSGVFGGQTCLLHPLAESWKNRGASPAPLSSLPGKAGVEEQRAASTELRVRGASSQPHPSGNHRLPGLAFLYGISVGNFTHASSADGRHPTRETRRANHPHSLPDQGPVCFGPGVWFGVNIRSLMILFFYSIILVYSI